MFPEWFEASRSLKVAISLTAVIFVVVNVSFFSPYWLQSFPDERLPNPKFTNLGKAYLFRTRIMNSTRLKLSITELFFLLLLPFLIG